MKVRLIFAWFDFWIGVYFDREKRRVFVLPVPCVGVVFTLRPKWRRDPDPNLDCEYFQPGPVAFHAECETDGHFECGRCIENARRLGLPWTEGATERPV